MDTPTPDDIASDVQQRCDTQLKRGLASRHMQMIAIGGAIGTGLFLASGATVANAGPGGALLAYAAIGLMVLLLMQSLGEMSAHQPVAGSFQTFATKFISPSFGFAMGWNYWFNWAVTVAADLVASGLVMAYWFPSVPSWIWAVVFLVIVVGLNALSARVYGEAEFWLAAIKVVIVVVFVISGVFMIAGVMGMNSPGLSNWSIGDAPFHNGFVGVIAVFMIAGFSFQGTELVGVAAGESENPQRDVPRSIRTVFWRIMFFYIGAIAVIGTLLPYTDPSLLSAAEESAEAVAQSPFTLVFARMGIGAAAAVMNAVILTSILSAGNSGLYAASRMLHSMALKHQAPAIFAKVTKGGVPGYAMAVTTVTAAFGFMTQLVFNDAYIWLVNIVGISGIIMWLGIAVSHIRFRRAYLLQGYRLEDLPYRSTSSRPGRSSRSSCAWWSWRVRTTRRSFTARSGRLPPPTLGCRSSVSCGGATTMPARIVWFRLPRWTSRPSRSNRFPSKGAGVGAALVARLPGMIPGIDEAGAAPLVWRGARLVTTW